jgi:hypothetical protein
VNTSKKGAVAELQKKLCQAHKKRSSSKVSRACRRPTFAGQNFGLGGALAVCVPVVEPTLRAK